MKLNLLSILLFTGIFSFAQYTYVPDDNFEYELMNLGLDDIQDDYVLTENINQITTLEIPYKNIADLTGIEGFTALEELNCSNNYLTELDVTQNLSLKVLHAASNQLTNLDVTENVQLNYLRLSYNNLTQLNVNQNPLLRYLAFNGNSLSSLDVSQNSLLNYLIGFENEIVNIDLSSNSELEQLKLDSNELSGINIDNLPKLEVFTCSNNQITDINFTQNPLLRIVICDYNQMSEIDISANPSVDLLLCSSNVLTSLNIKNRNNYETFDFESTSNPNLFCIDVDNVDWANNNWNDPNHTDSWSNFSIDCENMSVAEVELNEIYFHPNPTKNFLNFSESLKEFTIYDLSGKLILKGNGIQTNVSNLSKGTYLLKGITNSGKTINQKFIKN